MRGFGFHLKAGGLNSRSHDEGSTRGCFAGLRKPGTLVYGHAGQQTGVLSLLEMSSGSRTFGGKDGCGRVESLDLDKKGVGHVTWHVTKG